MCFCGEEKFETRKKWQLQPTVNALNASELYTLKWLSCYGTSTSIKKKKVSNTKETKRKTALCQGFSTSAPPTLWARELCVAGAVLCYGMLSSILGLYSLDANSKPLNCDNQKCLRTFPNVLWGTKTIPKPLPLPTENHCSRLRDQRHMTI